MKIVTIIKDDYFNPVVYGVVEIPDKENYIYNNINKYNRTLNKTRTRHCILSIRQK